jgi:hypothetical protein
MPVFAQFRHCVSPWSGGCGASSYSQGYSQRRFRWLYSLERAGPWILNHRTAALPFAHLRSEIMAAGGWLMVTVGPVQFRHEVPKEVDLAARRWKGSPPGGFLCAQAEVCQGCRLLRRTTPEACGRQKALSKPPKATTKPYTRHILGIYSGVQSHLKATLMRP